MFNGKLKKDIEKLSNNSKSLDNKIDAVQSRIVNTISNIDKRLEKSEKSNKETKDRISDISHHIENSINAVNKNIDNVNSENSKKNHEIVDQLKKIQENNDKLIISERESRNLMINTLKEGNDLELKRMGKKIDTIFEAMEKSLNDKFKQLELFKAGEEIIGQNPFGHAVVNELVRRAFDQKEKDLERREKIILDEKEEIKSEYIRLKHIKCIGVANPVDLKEKLGEAENQMHKYHRQSTTSNDDAALKAKSLEEAIKIIKELVYEK